MTLRYLLDEDLSPVVAVGLRNRDIDAVSVHETGRAGLGIPDEEQLQHASENGRALVTYNRADFQILDAQWRVTGRDHAGIVWGSERMIPRRAFGELIRALEALAQAFDSLDNLCVPLPRAEDTRA